LCGVWQGEAAALSFQKKKGQDAYAIFALYHLLGQGTGQGVSAKAGEAGYMGGLYEFFLMEEGALHSLEVLVAGREDFPNDFTLLDSSTHRHLLTHQRLHCRFFVVALKGVNAATQRFFHAHGGLKPYDEEEVAGLPLPILLAHRWQAWLEESSW
jgi:hypothetical protein